MMPDPRYKRNYSHGAIYLSMELFNFNNKLLYGNPVHELNIILIIAYRGLSISFEQQNQYLYQPVLSCARLRMPEISPPEAILPGQFDGF